jgi:1-phosphatidylinositol-4-phosphate 5-kinase
MEKNLQAIHKSGESTGKSGSFMFMSHCGQFIIKTMFESEFDIIMGDLEKYSEYIVCHPNSLLSRFYGIFEVLMEDMAPIKLILM